MTVGNYNNGPTGRQHENTGPAGFYGGSNGGVWLHPPAASLALAHANPDSGQERQHE